MVTLFHFNDIYNIEARKKEPVGGASRFATLVKQLRAEHDDMKLIFGGDALSPSLVSTVTRGKHIPPIFNELGVNYACCGNHDFDFGTERFTAIMKLCKFPWMLANIVSDVGGGKEEPLSGAIPYLVEDINGMKVGLMGLAEEEWLECLTKLPESTRYIDQAEVGRKLCAELRQKGCKIIIALTHSREPQDTFLANNCPDIDIILGGHDHDYYIRQVNGIPILHSGCEFRSGTLVNISLNDPNEEVDVSKSTPTDDDTQTKWTLIGKRVTCSLEKKMITAELEADETMTAVIDSCNESVKKKMLKVLGESSTDWDVRFQNCRLQENAVGSFLTDLMREAYGTDMGLLCGGTLRSNDIYTAGKISMGDIMKILPFPDTVSVVKIKGKFLLQAMENGVSAYPSSEGRFPQVSGVKLEFDPSKPPGERVTKFLIAGGQIEEEKVYTLATKPFLLKGGDGYGALANFEKMIVDDEGIPLATLFRNFFIEMKVYNAFTRGSRVNDLVDTAFTSALPTCIARTACPKIDGRISIIQ